MPDLFDMTNRDAPEDEKRVIRLGTSKAQPEALTVDRLVAWGATLGKRPKGERPAFSEDPDGHVARVAPLTSLSGGRSPLTIKSAPADGQNADEGAETVPFPGEPPPRDG